MCGLFVRWLHPWALLSGWVVGMISGTAMAVSLGLRSSVYPLPLFGTTYPMYAAIPALALNLAVSALLTFGLRFTNVRPAHDTTDPAAYIG